MAVIDVWRDRLFQKYGEKWLAKGECSLLVFLELLEKGRKSIKMVTGELDPDLYNRSDVTEKLKTLLDNKVSLEIVFHKKDSKNEAIQDLLYNNAKIIELKKIYHSFLKLYWQKERAETHFAVADASHVFIEEPHKAYKPRGTFIKYKTELLGRYCNQDFEKIRQKESQEITLEEILAK